MGAMTRDKKIRQLDRPCETAELARGRPVAVPDAGSAGISGSAAVPTFPGNALAQNLNVAPTRSVLGSSTRLMRPSTGAASNDGI